MDLSPQAIRLQFQIHPRNHGSVCAGKVVLTSPCINIFMGFCCIKKPVRLYHGEQKAVKCCSNLMASASSWWQFSCLFLNRSFWVKAQLYLKRQFAINQLHLHWAKLHENSIYFNERELQEDTWWGLYQSDLRHRCKSGCLLPSKVSAIRLPLYLWPAAPVFLSSQLWQICKIQQLINFWRLSKFTL